jgi:hypothetical protein
MTTETLLHSCSLRQVKARSLLLACRVPDIVNPLLLSHEASYQTHSRRRRWLEFHPVGNRRIGSTLSAGRAFHPGRIGYSLFAVRLGQASARKITKALSENRPPRRSNGHPRHRLVATHFSP